ncbi:MAG TPA: hypothetical protein VGM11_09040 [Acidobacteriaceae bacterium]|jgi:hypothetical protein
MLFRAAKTTPAIGQIASSTDGRRNRSGNHFTASLLCAAGLLGALAITWPFVELATDDDFAYANIALIFARTGHFVYNGWETAMLGWQVLWGALFIRLFGYSYLTLRASVVLLALLFAILLHRTLLRSGVSSGRATFGTLTVVLSPMFLPMAVSYMTDVPAMLCILVCLYGCQRALRAGSDRAALLWLCGSAALNVLDGTVRQIAWLGALVTVPSAFWLLRNRRGFKTVAVITWLAGALCIALFMRWFSHQPYILPEPLIRGHYSAKALKLTLRAAFYGPFEILLFALPVLAAWLQSFDTLTRRRKIQILIACCAIAPLLLVDDRVGQIIGRVPPWSPNVITRYGILWTVQLMGDHPVTLSAMLMFLTALFLGACILGFIATPLRRRSLAENANANPTTLTLRETATLILPSFIAYFALLLPRSAFPSTFSDIYDRYFLPLIMLAVILLLSLYERQIRKPLPLTCYAVLFFFTFFGICGTHDLFAGFRACARARALVEARGIASTDISGPWEQDAQMQIDAQGYLNDERITNPPGAYRVVPHPLLGDCPYWFGPLLPALHTHYVLTITHLSCVQPSSFPDYTFSTWLPPYKRAIYIERVPGQP